MLICIVLFYSSTRREKGIILYVTVEIQTMFISLNKKIELIQNENTVMIVIIIIKNDVPGVVRYGYICLRGV